MNGIAVFNIPYFIYVFIFARYVAQYNDIASPLSNAEKLAESSRREEELRRERERERDEASKAYHERESRVPMTAQQRKGNLTHRHFQQQKSIVSVTFLKSNAL